MGKYKTGDKVRIVNYGHLIWIHENEIMNYDKSIGVFLGKNGFMHWYDIRPEKIGRIYVVANENDMGGSYQLNNLDGSYGFAWADEKQLELIND